MAASITRGLRAVEPGERPMVRRVDDAAGKSRSRLVLVAAVDRDLLMRQRVDQDVARDLCPPPASASRGVR